MTPCSENIEKLRSPEPAEAMEAQRRQTNSASCNSLGNCCKPNIESDSVKECDRVKAEEFCEEEAAPKDTCQNSCCSPKVEAATPSKDTGCCTEKNACSTNEELSADITDQGECASGCCGGEKETKAPDAKPGCCSGQSDSCCESEKPSKTELNNPGCNDGCCSSDPKPEPAGKKPGCCEDKLKGCCDESCLDRLARRECEKMCGGGCEATSDGYTSTKRDSLDSSTSSSTKRTACSEHKLSIRERYGATLEILGCLCKELLARNQESCCSTSGAYKKDSALSRTKKQTKKSCSRAKEAACTVGVSTSSQPCSGNKNVKHRARVTKTKDCCSKASCCSEGTGAPSKVELKAKTTTSSLVADVESGLPNSEHAVVSISGMTCTGCETKLQRTLASVESIRNLQTSLVLSRAEFDFDPRTSSLPNIIKHLERTTEFKCKVMKTEGSELEVLPNMDPRQFCKLAMPTGVTAMEAAGKGSVRLFFDPNVIGARDLVRNGFPHKLELAPVRAHASLEAGQKHLRNLGALTLLSALLTIPVLVLAWAPLEERPVTYSSTSLALATIVQVVIAGPFYPKAIKSLVFSRVIEMDLLIVLSTSAAYVFSVVSYAYLMLGRPLSTGEFFETSTLLVTLIMVGRYVSALARQKAVESISIRSLQSNNALLVKQDGSQGDEIDARLLQYGDIFQVPPESRIPTDGTIISGNTEVDESMITGESQPVEKRPGSVVIAGSLNGPGKIIVRLSRLPQENTISAIAEMVDEAKLSKPKIQEIADKVASYFVPVVLVLTTITFVIWIAIGVQIRRQSASEAAVQAITYAITVLIVSCPCAIGLAVPMVIVIAGGVSAKAGVLLKSPSAIEIAHKTSHVIFDKTGTLTQGNMSVARVQYPNEEREQLSSVLLGVLESSKHPVSSAVTKHLKDKGVSSINVNDAKTIIGRGIEGSARGIHVLGGNARWLGLESDPLVEPLLSQGYTVFCVMIDSKLYAVFGLEDKLRPDAKYVVDELLRRNISVSIISGDDKGAVKSVAQQLGVVDYKAKCSPEDKRDYIKSITSTTGGITLFCGDGTNDAVAIAQASIGVHVNEGTDVARSAADVVLVRPSLKGILFLLDISKACVRRIAFNFGWSFVYNLFAILLAAGAFVKARIPPEFAGLGELVSVLPVILIALQLRWVKLTGA